MRRLTLIACGVLIALAITMAPADSFGQTTIDDFQTGQTVTNAAPNVAGPSGGIVGQYRTGRVVPASANASMSISGGQASFEGDPAGQVVLEWDGDSDTSTFDVTGLGGVDLTMSGGMPQVGMTFDVLSTGPYEINMVIVSDEDHGSSIVKTGTGPETVTLLFADFSVDGPSGGADFTSVGAIMMAFDGNDDFMCGPITTAPDPSLPVELASFDAIASGTVVDLKWAVSSQVDNAGFDVEHRVVSAAPGWEKMGFVAATGTNEEAFYSFRTDVAVAGRHQFRLRMVDLDGSFTYSPTTEVSVDVPGSFMLSRAYPNPFNPSTAFTLSLARSQNVAISVYDLLGRQVKELHQGFLEGSQTHQFRLDASDLSTGIYMIKASGDFDAASEMVTLVK